jgi:hypothetical protein
MRGANLLLDVSAFQINDSAMFTVKDGDELVTSGICRASFSEDFKRATLVDPGWPEPLVCSVETKEYDPVKHGAIPGQARFFWTGKAEVSE